tara:strand:+ start:13679 stop:14665 length:987 start_codon:yes stop_codon:yes gene_type:complete
MKKFNAGIKGVHAWFPPKKITNKDLEKMVDTNDEWIVSRTGIKERRILDDGLATSDLAVKAIEGLLKKKNINAKEIDLIICATATPDMLFPSTACIVADKIKAVNAFCFDLMAACSGFLFSLDAASKYIESGKYKKIIVVGADKMSSIVDYTDRKTCVLFGDGAGAVLLEPCKNNEGIIDSVLKSDGSGRNFLKMKAGGSLNPSTIKTVKNKEHFIHQEGQQVFKFAVKKMADVSEEIMKKNKLNGKDISWLVPHQANKRIIDATANRMEISKNKVMLNIEKYGNTTNATIPSCLYEWEKKLNKGDNLILAAFGGGFTWGSIYLKWIY